MIFSIAAFKRLRSALDNNFEHVVVRADDLKALMEAAERMRLEKLERKPQ